MALGTRELILDANLAKRLASELRFRGFAVERLANLGIARIKDEPMLEELREKREPADIVLVTADDKMPFDHGGVIARTGFTIATIDGRWEGKGYNDQEAWRRDIVHRWAHKMADHADKEIRRYSPGRGVKWTPRWK